MGDSTKTDIEKAQRVLDSGKRLLRDLECFPMRILIYGEPVNCTVSPKITRTLQGLVMQLEETIAAAKSPLTPLCERGESELPPLVKGD